MFSFSNAFSPASCLGQAEINPHFACQEHDHKLKMAASPKSKSFVNKEQFRESSSLVAPNLRNGS